jgi:hypothetical protein
LCGRLHTRSGNESVCSVKTAAGLQDFGRDLAAVSAPNERSRLSNTAAMTAQGVFAVNRYSGGELLGGEKCWRAK